ncbi:MAG: efflux RND transporter permease subunit [Pseudomonadota bacterium]
MTGLVDWAASRARMVLAFVVLSLLAGALSYVGLPKEGEPDIEVPALFVSVQFPGISAEDSEKLLVKVMETEFSDLDGLETMYGTAADNYAGVALEFEFGWDKTQTMADVRDAMNAAEAEFPEGYEKYSINEFNFSTFPIVVVSLSGPVPERAMARIAKNLQDRIEALEPVLEAGIAGERDEMVEVIIDPLQLEAYNITATELIEVVTNNNQLIAADEIQSDQGSFAVKIPSSFDAPIDIYNLPVKTNGDRVITLGDLTDISLTFEPRAGTARFNGEPTIALQVVKRKGFNIIDTVQLVEAEIALARQNWPEDLRSVITMQTSQDQSRVIEGMVRQLEGSVLTAISLVMIVTLAALGIRPAFLVGFAIPTSFLLCFALLAVMGVAISNMVMFGLILAVGMLVDGAIVVVEYADKRIARGDGPMTAYVAAAKRMFWPVVTSTATTLCAFMPMLFWPGIPGQFMRMLPITLIFVLSASLLVALVYLPVLGGVTGRIERWTSQQLDRLSTMRLPLFLGVLGLALVGLIGAGGLIEPLITTIGNRLGAMDGGDLVGSVVPTLVSVFVLALGMLAAGLAGLAGAVTLVLGSIALGRKLRHWMSDIDAAVATKAPWCPPPSGLTLVVVLVVGLVALGLNALTVLILGGLSLAALTLRSKFARRKDTHVSSGYRRTAFGHFIHAITGNPVMPLVACCAIFVIVGTTMMFYAGNNRGVEFFVDTEPENALIFVRARGNLSIEQKDTLVQEVEEIAMAHPNVLNAFSFAGDGGLNVNTGGAEEPIDTIGQVNLELVKWEDRPLVREVWFTLPLLGLDITREVKAPEAQGQRTLADLTQTLSRLPGIETEIMVLEQGPSSPKPVHLRLKGEDPQALEAFTALAREKFENTYGLRLVEDTLPLPGIDWQIDVDVEKAGRFGADVASVGGMVQLVTRGLTLGTMRVPSSVEEVDIRVRLPEEYRVLSTLDTLKVRTDQGLVPLSNFVSRQPVPKRGQIDRIDQSRYYDVKAAVTPGLSRMVTDEAGDTSELLINPNERIAHLTEWLESGVVPSGIFYEWTGDAEDQAESSAFLSTAFAGALGLMFIILLAQFNSVYNAVLVLLAVVLSTTGVLIGMLVMNQAFSIIMTGTGIVALAGIVVNNNIVLIDTYQDYARYMPRIEAIVRTAEARIRPVLLTTITTMAGLTPMMFGLSLDFFNGGYTVDSPTALWWKQLATAVVFGLGIATVLTLVFTPSMLALRVWAITYVDWSADLMARLSLGRGSRAARDWALARRAGRVRQTEILWTDAPNYVTPSDMKSSAEKTEQETPRDKPLRAAE